MSKRKKIDYGVYSYLEEQPNAKNYNGVPSLFLNDSYWREEYEEDDIIFFSNTSKTEDIKNMLKGAVGATGTALSAGIVIWPLTKIAEMGVIAVYTAARVSFAGKRGLQDSAEFIRNSVNWMLGDKDAFHNTARMNKLEQNIQTEMTKIGDLYNNSKDKDFKDKYLKYMIDYDSASKKDFFPNDKIKLQKELLESLSKNKDMDFYQKNKSRINGILENIQKYEKLNHAAEEIYRRSDTNEALSNILESAKKAINKPLREATDLTKNFATKLIDAKGRITSPKVKTPIRSRSESREF